MKPHCFHETSGTTFTTMASGTRREVSTCCWCQAARVEVYTKQRDPEHGPFALLRWMLEPERGQEPAALCPGGEGGE